MARRSRPVRKLLDEPLKVAGLLTLRSCGVVFCVYGVCYFVLELMFGLWSRLLGGWSLFGPIACAVAVGAILRLAEVNVDDFLARLRTAYETSAVPGHFFGLPNHFRIGMGVDTEMFREGLHRIDRALVSP